jgi:hypothetical protein
MHLTSGSLASTGPPIACQANKRSRSDVANLCESRPVGLTKAEIPSPSRSCEVQLRS